MRRLGDGRRARAEPSRARRRGAAARRRRPRRQPAAPGARPRPRAPPRPSPAQRSARRRGSRARGRRRVPDSGSRATEEAHGRSRESGKADRTNGNAHGASNDRPPSCLTRVAIPTRHVLKFVPTKDNCLRQSFQFLSEGGCGSSSCDGWLLFGSRRVVELLGEVCPAPWHRNGTCEANEICFRNPTQRVQASAFNHASGPAAQVRSLHLCVPRCGRDRRTRRMGWPGHPPSGTSLAFTSRPAAKPFWGGSRWMLDLSPGTIHGAVYVLATGDQCPVECFSPGIRENRAVITTCAVPATARVCSV
jgi:hypothetical protein